ncbi:NAD(P)-binding protein [Setomelanomma holmii]|uniref:NAD(P)-binding protein n=1 Tax=Setomelanomma holmii TaxID=210430 RepID=A0A9P4LKK2_9PLEO|nr:NAD(P)-binding protein [Setomelanomma holmii]
MASEIIAVAGGSGKLGRAIVDQLNAHGGYKVFILGREANTSKSKEIGAQILAVDYSNPDALVATLETNSIDTVISTLGSTFGIDPELALIAAADKSKVTRRYIPSLWGIRYTPEVSALLPIGQLKRSILDTLAASGLEYTSVINGLFMDYYGLPHVRSYLHPFPLAIDVASNTAGIPGSGDVPVTFTYTFDIGRFAALLLQKPQWERESVTVGDKLTWNEFLAVAEEVKGVKFDVTYDKLETLKQGKVTELPGHVVLYPFFPKEALQGLAAVFGLLMEEGHFDLGGEVGGGEFETKKVRELVTEAWSGKA